MSASLRVSAEQTHDIFDTVINDGSFSNLITAVKAAGLVETLKGPGPFTVFAPSDDAFKALPHGTVERLLKPENKEELVRILKSHVIAGKIMSADLKGKKFSRKAVGGVELLFDGNDSIKVNKAKIVTLDILASNGVIQVIDAVIMPTKG
jgi:uncharacterized surface protein with fasciclin (FAS1) repeats